MNRQTDTSWIVEGAKVAVYTSGHLGDRVRFTTVERLTDTQVVLAGTTTRFRRDDLTEVRRRGGYDTERTELVRPDDHRVTDLRARAALRKLTARIGELAKVDKDAGSAEVLAALEQIEHAVVTTRKAITEQAPEGR
jgi:hypothetical protein